MSSPRPSSPSFASTASSSRNASPAGRTSLSATGAPSTTSTRRPNNNRAALRDYYGLKSAGPVSANKDKDTSPQPSSNGGDSSHHQNGRANANAREVESELDGPEFDAAAYVRRVLAEQDLAGVLRAEGGLINEIKSLDGEKKALVYDNYSKLITATETIGKMRRNMDPLTPTTSTLAPAVAYIAETTAALRERSMADTAVATAAATAGAGAGSTRDSQGKMEGERDEAGGGRTEEGQRRRQVETVRWVLDAPRRLGTLVEAGQREEADGVWEEVSGLLKKWNGVDGVEEVRSECKRIMGSA